uniref:Uncharacterized protein n=1 Tax=Timema shepardi TaxID=629360 RepID=A0A7R9B4D0_TIMSH|nr:unnamed protein product [Timema shepardi]
MPKQTFTTDESIDNARPSTSDINRQRNNIFDYAPRTNTDDSFTIIRETGRTYSRFNTLGRDILSLIQASDCEHPDTIAILPKGGCRCGDRQSVKAIKCLVYLEKTRSDIHIQHAFDGREIEILGRKVDGYCETTREIFEFDGCFLHGPCLSNHDVTITGTKETLTERYECTLLRDRTFRVAFVSWTYRDEAILPLDTVNVPIATYVTTGARTWVVLVFTVTRTILSVIRPTDTYMIPTGDKLGDITNELTAYSETAYITVSVSGGPKNYSYNVFVPETNEYRSTTKVRAGTYGRISSRSSLALHHGIDVLARVIDEDYRVLVQQQQLCPNMTNLRQCLTIKDQFYITLLSNGSMGYFPKYTLANFTTHLSYRLKLESQWEVALAGFKYPCSFTAVPEGQNIVWYIWVDASVVEQIFNDHTPPGNYSTNLELIKTLNELEAFKGDSGDLFKYTKPYKKLNVVSSSPNIQLLALSSQLGVKFGFDPYTNLIKVQKSPYATNILLANCSLSTRARDLKFFSGHFKSIVPLPRSGAKANGNKALHKGIKVVSNVTNKRRPFKEAIRQRVGEAGTNLKRKSPANPEEAASNQHVKKFAPTSRSPSQEFQHSVPAGSSRCQMSHRRHERQEQLYTQYSARKMRMELCNVQPYRVARTGKLKVNQSRVLTCRAGKLAPTMNRVNKLRVKIYSCLDLSGRAAKLAPTMDRLKELRVTIYSCLDLSGRAAKLAPVIRENPLPHIRPYVHFCDIEEGHQVTNPMSS